MRGSHLLDFKTNLSRERPPPPMEREAPLSPPDDKRCVSKIEEAGVESNNAADEEFHLSAWWRSLSAAPGVDICQGWVFSRDACPTSPVLISLPCRPCPVEKLASHHFHPFYPLLSTFVHFNPCSSTFTGFHPLSSSFIHLHPLLRADLWKVPYEGIPFVHVLEEKEGCTAAILFPSIYVFTFLSFSAKYTYCVPPPPLQTNRGVKEV